MLACSGTLGQHVIDFVNSDTAQQPCPVCNLALCGTICNAMVSEGLDTYPLDVRPLRGHLRTCLKDNVHSIRNRLKTRGVNPLHRRDSEAVITIESGLQFLFNPIEDGGIHTSSVPRCKIKLLKLTVLEFDACHIHVL